jgi:hypothetical protein
MRRRLVSRLLVLLTIIPALAAAGCGHPLSAYEQGRQMLDRGHQRLLQGDTLISARSFEAAATTYGRAASDLDAALAHFQQAEVQVMDEIRQREQQQRLRGTVAPPTTSTTITIGTRTVEVDAFYADTLRGYREARALAAVLDALALARAAEAHYRHGAIRTHTGDQAWQNDQFYTAHKNYRESRDSFLQARQAFGRASVFIDQQMLASSQLSEAAPHESWQTMKALQPLISRRQAQIDAWIVTLDRRVASAGQIVTAYRQTRPGNLPGINKPFLEPLPSETRIAVQHPPIPANRTARGR